MVDSPHPAAAAAVGQTAVSRRYATNAATNGKETAVGGIPARRRVAPARTNKRIEIKAHALSDGSRGLYWRWRWQENGRRRSAYGGTIGTLVNEARIRQYRRNSRRYWRRVGELRSAN